MSSTAHSASALGRSEPLLRALIARGFQFLHPRTSDGGVAAVVGVRAHHNVVDVVRLQSECTARAVRLPSDEKDVLAPAPDRILWETTGTTHDTLTDLLALPEQHMPQTDRDITLAPSGGCWVPVRPGTTKWLAAAS